MELSSIYRDMVENWDGPWVQHREIAEFSFGLLSRGTLANLTSRGEGPDFHLVNGKKVSEAKEMAAWLQGRNEIDDGTVVAATGKEIKEFDSFAQVPNKYTFVYEKYSGKILKPNWG